MTRGRKIDKAVDVMFGLLFTGLLIVLIGCFFGMFGVEPIAAYIAISGAAILLLSAVVGLGTLWYHIFTG